MDTGILRAELQALQRGRGVARPHVERWAGPTLLGLVKATCPTDKQPGEHLVNMLIDAVLSLPTDLRFLFLMAAGIKSDEPLLKNRLLAAGRVLDRDPRTLSRRLREAEALLADLLLQGSEPEPSVYETGGWLTSRLALQIDAYRRRPRVVVSPVLRATRDRQTTYRYTIAVGVAPAADEEPVVTGLEGATMLSMGRASERSWIVTFAVPPVSRGRSHEASFEVEFPDRRYLQPFAAFAPIKPCVSLDVQVDFGQPGVAAESWRVDTVPPALVTDKAGGAQALGHEGVVTASFTGLVPGYAYGIAWRWASTAE